MTLATVAAFVKRELERVCLCLCVCTKGKMSSLALENFPDFYIFLCFLEASGCGLMIICHVPLWFIRSKNSIKHSSPLTLRYLILTHFIRRVKGKNKTFDTEFLRRSLYQRGTLIVFCALEQLCLLFVTKNAVFTNWGQHHCLLPKASFVFIFQTLWVFVKDHSTNQRQLMVLPAFVRLQGHCFLFFFVFL